MTLAQLPITPFCEINPEAVTIARVAVSTTGEELGFELRVDGVWIGRAYANGGHELQDWWIKNRNMAKKMQEDYARKAKRNN